MILVVIGYYFTTRPTTFHEYRDAAYHYSFELGRDFGGALGWLKPSDADIDQGVVTSLGYEEGFFLQLYRPVKGKAANFALVGKQVYEKGRKFDHSRTYSHGEFSTVGGKRAFIFETQVKFNDKEFAYEYWAADKITDEQESKDSRPLVPAKVAYLTHNGLYFRIIYDPNNQNAVKTFNSFRFF